MKLTAEPEKGIYYTPKDAANLSEPDFQHHFFSIYFGRRKNQKLQEIYWLMEMHQKTRRLCRMMIYTKDQVKHIQDMLNIQYHVHQVRILSLPIHPNY